MSNDPEIDGAIRPAALTEAAEVVVNTAQFDEYMRRIKRGDPTAGQEMADWLNERMGVETFRWNPDRGTFMVSDEHAARLKRLLDETES